MRKPTDTETSLCSSTNVGCYTQSY